MNENWDKAIAFVLLREGGYTFDQNDPGGETNYGISKKSYPNLDIKNLTIDQAKDIYLKDYWQKCACDQLAFPYDIIVFDTAVNMGVSKAIRLLQIALDVDVDGIVGSKTISTSFKSKCNGVKQFLAKRLVEYHRLMADNNSLNVFALNWFYRVIALSALIFEIYHDGNGGPSQ